MYNGFLLNDKSEATQKYTFFITLKAKQAFFKTSSDPQNPQANTGVRISER